MSQPETKQRILSAAEHHFARSGYHATSLRSITATAKVNLAAVNYHFGSKEALLEAVIVRRLTPLNALRLGQLEDRLRRADQDAVKPTCRDILRTFVEPTLQLRREGSGAGDFIALIGRTLAEPRGVAMTIFMRHMEPLMVRFYEALSRSLPELSRQALFWRLHFAIGSLSHIMRCHERYALTPSGVNIDLPVDELVELYLDYATAGMEMTP